MSKEIYVERVSVRKTIVGDGMDAVRALPTKQRRMVGAWCFLDHLGPVIFSDGQGMHVGAHPHTRLQTFTWMIEGEILHRDSLGSEQVLRCGEVNLMTAGYGISHTEDSLPDCTRMHAAQLWIALPDAVANQPPSFAHYSDIPKWQTQGCTWSLMAGSYGDYQAPTKLYSPLLGLELLASNESDVQLQLNTDFEYGLLALTGGFTVHEQAFAGDALAYFAPGLTALSLKLQPGTRLLVLGGQPFTEPVVLWWNFIGQDWESIQTYRTQWVNGDTRFGEVKGQGKKLIAPELPL